MRTENIHVSIHNTTFEINPNKAKLIEVCNPHNTIAFNLFQKFDDRNLWLPYGLETKNASFVPSEQTKEWQSRFILPAEVFSPDFEGTDQQMRLLNNRLLRYNPEIRLANHGLPIYTLEGTPFIVDVRNNRLCEQRYPINELSFRDMTYVDSGYIVNYDLNWNAINNDYRGPHIIPLVIPHKTQLDPKTMSDIYGYPVHEIRHKTDFSVIVDQRLLNQRRLRNFPSINMAGKIYYLNVTAGCFEPKITAMSKLNIKDFRQNRLSPTMTGYLDTQTYEMVKCEPGKESDLPKTVVKIELPNETTIDPYGVALKKGWNLKDTLLKYPLQKHITARMTWLSDPMKHPIDLPKLHPKTKIKTEATDLKHKKENKGHKPGR